MTGALTQWWNGLSSRERGLIAVALVLSILFVGWFGLASPAVAAKTRAEASFQTLQTHHQETLRGLSALQGRRQRLASSSVDRSAIDELDVFLTRSAQSVGLTLSRLQTAESGGVTLVFEEVSGAALLAWATQIEAESEARIERLDLDVIGDGRVRASVQWENP